MSRSIVFLFISIAAAASSSSSFAAAFIDPRAQAKPAGALVKHLSHVLKWTKSSPKVTQHDGDMVEFESGYFVETLVEGDKLGMVPHTIRVSPEGELFAVDATSNNIVRVTPPLSQCFARTRQGIGILVSELAKKTNASYSLGEPSEVREFLNRLVEWKRHSSKN